MLIYPVFSKIFCYFVSTTLQNDNIMIHNLSQLTDKAKNKPVKKIAVAAAEDVYVLSALKKAVSENIIQPVLIGNKEEINRLAKSIDFDLTDILIINNPEIPFISAQRAVRLVREGDAGILMKGAVSTAELLKAVLDKENGLRKAQVLSHVAFFESPYYYKLLCVTDVAMNIAPDLETKVQILNNAVEACSRIGITMPKAAIAAAVETVNPKMEATVHAQMLKEMNRRNEITGCIVDGPLAIDLAVSRHAALQKGIKSEVAGDADIVLAPDIEAGNMFYKALNFLGGAKSAAVIMGAAAPIVLTSRSDDEETKFLSIVLAAAME